MNDKEREAKIAALDEAAEHLIHGGWSEDEEELRQGRLVAAELQRRADRLAH